MAVYEVEIKTLLGEKERAEKLMSRMQELDSSCKCVDSSTQLNHYFEGGNPVDLIEVFKPLLSEKHLAVAEEIIEKGTKISVRTREVGGVAKLVMKASVDDTTSENGIQRMEFEEVVEGKSLDEVDALVLSAGYEYQAKWSRSRDEYVFKGVNVCIDKNAGYGYLAEFEKVIEDEGSVSDAQKEIHELMSLLGVEELAQDRLARMFEFYNKNWSDYYGTDKVFVIE